MCASNAILLSLPCIAKPFLHRFAALCFGRIRNLLAFFALLLCSCKDELFYPLRGHPLAFTCFALLWCSCEDELINPLRGLPLAFFGSGLLFLCSSKDELLPIAFLWITLAFFGFLFLCLRRVEHPTQRVSTLPAHRGTQTSAANATEPVAHFLCQLFTRHGDSPPHIYY